MPANDPAHAGEAAPRYAITVPRTGERFDCAAGEPIPHDQAVEDGFSECPVCRPEAAETPEVPATPANAGPAGAPAGVQAEVWVVDGFPAGAFLRDVKRAIEGASAEG